MRKLVLASVLVIAGSVAFMATTVYGDGGNQGRSVIIGPIGGNPGNPGGGLSGTSVPCTVSVLSGGSSGQWFLVPNPPGPVPYKGFQDRGFRQDQYPGFSGQPGFDFEDLFSVDQCP